MTGKQQQSILSGFDVRPGFIIFYQGWCAVLTEMKFHLASAVDAGQADKRLSQSRHMEGVQPDCNILYALMQEVLGPLLCVLLTSSASLVPLVRP